MEKAEKRWRKVNAAHLVPLVRDGIKFPDGKTRLLPALAVDSAEKTQLVETATLV